MRNYAKKTVNINFRSQYRLEILCLELGITQHSYMANAIKKSIDTDFEASGFDDSSMVFKDEKN